MLLFSFVISLYAVIITALWWLQKRSAKTSCQVPATTFSDRPILHPEGHKNTDAMHAKADEAQRLQLTFQKFVPRQFVDHFAKGGADSLTLGYADEAEVSVMFCDIRGFTSLSEQMSPQQLMNFLNSYFLRMNAPIHDNFGFIDKFIGDAIMALFDHPSGTALDKATDAINAALDLQKALHLYNHHRHKSGYPPVKHGIGMHYGAVVLGTVGSDDRMDTTVIGDTVNIAQRIESLTRYFGLDILCTRALIDASKLGGSIAHRVIDNVVLKGRSSSTEIVEIFEHLDERERKIRAENASLIVEGIELRGSRNFRAALAVFEKGKKVDPNDKVFDHHIQLCQKLMYQADWDGFVNM